MTNDRRNFVPGGCQARIGDARGRIRLFIEWFGIYPLDWGGDVAANTTAFGER
jgi:hypothetical protein